MNLIKVIPIERGIHKEMLTYFSTNEFTPGHMVSITVRNKKIPGLIHSTEPLSPNKGDLKQLPFTIKKISSESERPFFSGFFMKAAENIAHHHVSSIGAVLEALIPQALLSQTKPPQTMTNEKPGKFELQIFQADDETRFAHYKSIIREEFARKKSVFILVPTAQDALFLKEILEKGIEQYTYVVHGSLTKKVTLELWGKICMIKHPILVIGTALFLSLPRIWSTIIVERESSRHYKMNARPFLDMRTGAEMIAKEIGANCIFSDVLLRIETLHRYDEGKISQVSKPIWRSLAGAYTHLVDLRRYNKEEKKFYVIGKDLQALINENKNTGRKLFIYVARRGVASQIVCRDCGNIVKCDHCSVPVVLHDQGGRNGRYFLCHTCGEKRPADETCKTCGGWNLMSLGVGIESVIESIKEIFPDIKSFRIDADSTPTPKKASVMVEDFYNNPGSILVGTDMAMYYLREQMEHVAVASLDSQFSLPDFRIQEKIFHTLLRLRSLASHVFLVQTRYTNNLLWEFALKGNLIDFYKMEKSDRKRFNYPPFKTLIKITYSGEQTSVRKEMANLKEYLFPTEISIFPAFIEIKKGKFVMHGLIRLEKNNWPNNDLYEKLRQLPPVFAVNVDPENLL